MSQNDFSIANQGFPQFRSDLNSALQALASTSAGATAPGTTYAYQFWYDTSTNLLKMRNADNDAWITLASFDQAADEWEVRTAVVQAVDSAGVVIKTDDGVARISVADSGAVTFSGDVLVADKVIHSGDTDTAIRFPSSDTVTVETAGSERMRIDSSGNLSFNSGFGSAGIAYGCRAWVSFNGAGTVAIRGSGNVSSITDNGTGDYTVNFTTAMPDANYSLICTSTQQPNATSEEVRAFNRHGTTAPATTSVRVLSKRTITGGSISDVDTDYLFVAIFR